MLSLPEYQWADMSKMKISRRNFIAGSASLGLSSFSAFPSVASSNRKNNDIAVIFELSGGNDGLNTHIPYSDDIYYRLRPKIGIREKDILKLDDAYGFNKSMKGMFIFGKRTSSPLLRAADTKILLFLILRRMPTCTRECQTVAMPWVGGQSC